MPELVCQRPRHKEGTCGWFNGIELLDISSSYQFILTKSDGNYKIIENINQKRINKQKKSIQSKLQKTEKMEMNNISLFGFTHDFKNLLHVIKGNAELDGVQVSLDYNHPGDPKVLFEMKI